VIDIVKLNISDEPNKDSRLAPQSILNQMKHVWGNETGKPMDEYMVYEWETWKKVKSNNRVVFLGGDHSLAALTFPQTRASQLVVIDAHFDLYGNTDKLSHGNWLKVLIEKGAINPGHITILGVRAWDKTELIYAHEKGIKYIPFRCDSSIKLSDEPIYLSIDIDGVDPAYAPGTGYMEPGGCSSRDLLEIVKTLRNANLVAMDIVEIYPTKDINDMTSKLAAKAIKEFL